MHNGCILKGGVGTGKTRTALAYFYQKEVNGKLKINGEGDTEEPAAPKDIYVITTARKRDEKDWESEALSFILSTNRELSVSGIQLKVDSWNNVLEYTEVKDAFFVFDEQRLVGSGAWVKAFLAIAKKNRWIMLSATPGDNWMDYIPVLVANGFYKNRTEFIRRHVVYSTFTQFPKVDRYVETRHLDNLRRRILVDMELERHTTRHVLQVTVPHADEAFQAVWKDRWHIYEERPIRDVGELYRVARRVVNSDPSRLGVVMEKLEKHKRLIVFYNFDYELEALRVLGGTLGIETAEWNGHKHQSVPESGSWLYLVQYAAGSEAWNCTTTDAIVYFSLNYSYKIFEQVMGRIDRMNTPYFDLYYYVLRSNTPIDKSIWQAVSTKRNFNERSLVKEWATLETASNDRISTTRDTPLAA
jgi:Arc/MetJ-type ribon-helix-helix transcriptional regulator